MAYHKGGGFPKSPFKGAKGATPPSNSAFPNYVNNNPKSEMHYPSVSTHLDKATPSQGEDWSLPAEMNDRKALSKTQKPMWPLRKGFSKDNGQGKIVTNHFTYTLTAKELYEYKILDLPAEKINRQVKEQNFEKALRACSFLQSFQGSFATNEIDTIISWKPIHEQMSSCFTVVTVDELEAEYKQCQVWSGTTVPIGEEGLALRFAFIREIKIQDLDQCSLAKPNYEDTNCVDIARCLNILISQSLNADVYKQSANKFFVKTARSRLAQSISLETVRGYFYNVKPGMGNIIVNFNLATSAFIRPILVSEFLSDHNTFTSSDAETLLKKLRVYVEYDRKSDDAEKTMRFSKDASRVWSGCRLFDESIGRLTFQKKKRDDNGKPLKDAKDNFIYEGPHLSVIDHLRTVFGRSIDSNLKAINVGKQNDPVWYPQEFLRIVPFQAYTKQVPEHLTAAMVNEACRNPAESRVLIETEGLRSLGFVQGSNASAFNLRNNVPLKLSSTMLTVPYQNLGFPEVLYNKPAMRASSWKLRPDIRFFNTNARAFKYMFFRMSDVDGSSPGFYDKLLKGQFARCGLQVAQAQNANPSYDAKVTSVDLKANLKKAKDRGVNLVILILRQSDRTLYRELKNLAERTFGLQSVCIVERLDKRDNFFGQYMQNISMKVNLKLGGVNHTALRPNERLSHTMILGADLSHPSTGSIAAVVGSVDPAGGKCLGSVRLQPLQGKDGEISDHEIIYTLEGMVYERLLHWNKFNPSNTSKLPDKIIYYRDGVSSGHYSKVKDIEIVAINRAYAKARTALKLPAKALQLTAIIVTKRHHTRFYVLPGQPGDRWGNGNTLSGTCVDKLVTSPYYQDFFLQSHSGIKGTAKPTHYFVIQDGIPDMGLEKIRDLVSIPHQPL
ncbi:Piwi-domain-containing protein [Bimuria novae-zelandiae CBS 107.79]|uniref:Piwi-domain-containing protein n=1 Tax=Bimuria novae-zelandiae CBS 107.79 TaxID=1447943 RepID=A0A6A5VC03_9PLEO|nr:Piwi-domain-containing protein [Bimuria novae-zelandiae CBS 107.79]